MNVDIHNVVDSLSPNELLTLYDTIIEGGGNAPVLIAGCCSQFVTGPTVYIISENCYPQYSSCYCQISSMISSYNSNVQMLECRNK